ncbi:dodecin [Streptomyces sp. NPDC051567]|uniref:dodecin n=1 Tax=Streptomyces sp. NPDC051567 TaxID=3365660 RepID=UPI003797CD93
MSNHTYKVEEIVGSSPLSVDDAIKNGVSRFTQKLRKVDWFEVTQIRGHIEDGAVAHYQVGMKVGFRLEETDGS